MKKIISVILAFAMCISMSAFANEAVIGSADTATDILVAETQDIPIKIISDNKIINTDTVVVNQRTLVPLRALLESTGAQVNWYNDTQEIDITRNGKTIRVQIGNSVMVTPDGNKELEAAPILHQGTTTYAPLRAIAEEFGISVDWDGGTKTILVRTPEGCPYVDIYLGATLEDYLTENGISPEDFQKETTLKYEDYKDKLYIETDNAVPLSAVATINGFTLEELCALFGLDVEAGKNMTWGEALDEIDFAVYIDVLMGASQYGMTTDSAMQYIRESYGLGNEYTLDTKLKYVRVIMDTVEAEYAKMQEEAQEALEEQKKKDLEELPSLTKNTIKFTITMNDGSKMSGELYPDLAPITVENFVKLCESKFYDGLIFHRVIDGFMIQGGGYDKNYEAKEKLNPIKGEFYDNGVTNALKHEKGVISMARTNDPDSATSEFFIVDEASPFLDGLYAAFGKITSGLNVLEKISKAETQTNEKGFADAPKNAIIIKSIRISK